VKIGVAQMRDHVERVVKKHDIVVRHVTRIRRSRCFPWDGAPPLMQFPVVRSAITYAVALHELGHYLGEHVDHPDCIVRERAAWQWARTNALVWTTGMERCVTWSLSSYERDLCAACPWRPQEEKEPNEWAEAEQKEFWTRELNRRDCRPARWISAPRWRWGTAPPRTACARLPTRS
jgi:hypothetical protein